jgi:glycosyltransferase involved in cell wall biosynthesis
MNLCFECSEYPPGPHGGIGTLIQTLARGLVRAGHRVRVIGTYPPGYPAPDREEDQGVEVWRLRQSPRRLVWVKARWDLYRLVSGWARRREVDLVEVPDYGGPAAGWPRLPVPVVARLSGAASFFGQEMGRPRKRYFYLERASLRRADFICSESRYLGEKTRELFGLESDPDAIIYNPVDLPDVSSFNGRLATRVMFAGTLTPKKGILPLVRSWPAVLEACPGAELHIWGKDQRTEKGESMERHLRGQLPERAAGSVVFHGHVSLPELLQEFHRAAVAVLPSYSEGFALTPIHAMAASCPTIYTTRGSGPELIEHGRDGLLVDPDQPGQIAEAIVRLLTDRNLADALGRAGRTRVIADFSLKELLARNEAFYRQCIARFRAGGGSVSIGAGTEPIR